MKKFLQKNTQSLENRRFQILFTTMLACMAVGVFLLGRNQHITYIAMGSFVALPSLIAAFVFMWLYYIIDLSTTPNRTERLLNTASRFLILLGLAATFFLILGIFDTVIPQQPSSVLGVSFVISMLLSYFLYVFSVALMRPNSQQLIHFVALGLVSCIVMGVAVDGTDDWWTKHFSALGASTASSALLFKIALVMTAFMFLIIGHRIALIVQKQSRDASRLPHHVRVRIILGFFYATAIASMVAAFVSYDQNYLVHDTAAKLLGVTVGLFIISSYWLFPRLPKSFLGYSAALVVASAISWPYVQSLALKLSYYEIVAAAGAVMWLSMFTHLLEASRSGDDAAAEKTGQGKDLLQ